MSDSVIDPDREKLSKRLQSLPEDLVKDVSVGFSYLSSIGPECRAKFFDFVIDNFSSRSAISAKEASDILNLDEPMTSDALLSTSVIVGLFADIDVQIEEFFEYGGRGLANEDDYPIIIELLSAVQDQKQQIQVKLNDSSLANEMIPSFRNLSGRVDLRLAFDNSDQLDRFTPIAVFYLTTDTEEEILFQASSRDLKRLRLKIDEMERHMALSEDLEVVRRGN